MERGLTEQMAKLIKETILFHLWPITWVYSDLRDVDKGDYCLTHTWLLDLTAVIRILK